MDAGASRSLLAHMCVQLLRRMNPVIDKMSIIGRRSTAICTTRHNLREELPKRRREASHEVVCGGRANLLFSKGGQRKAEIPCCTDGTEQEKR